MVSTCSCCSCERLVPASNCAEATTPLSGVRISWLMVARNSALIRADSSARSLARRSACSAASSCSLTGRSNRNTISTSKAPTQIAAAIVICG